MTVCLKLNNTIFDFLPILKQLFYWIIPAEYFYSYILHRFWSIIRNEKSKQSFFWLFLWDWKTLNKKWIGWETSTHFIALYIALCVLRNNSCHSFVNGFFIDSNRFCCKKAFYLLDPRIKILIIGLLTMIFNYLTKMLWLWNYKKKYVFCRNL